MSYRDRMHDYEEAVGAECACVEPVGILVPPDRLDMPEHLQWALYGEVYLRMPEPESPLNGGQGDKP